MFLVPSQHMEKAALDVEALRLMFLGTIPDCPQGFLLPQQWPGLGRIRFGTKFGQRLPLCQTRISPHQGMFLYLSFPVLVCCNIHHHHLFLFLLLLLLLFLLLLLLLRSSALEDSIKQYEQDLARKLYQSRQWAPAPGARPAQMSSPVQSHASRIPGSGGQSRCAQPPPHSCMLLSVSLGPSWRLLGQEDVGVIPGVHCPENKGGCWGSLMGRKEQMSLRAGLTFSQLFHRIPEWGWKVP